MRIGVGRLILDYYNNENLRLKTQKIEKLCKELRKKFNLSALEVSDFDDLERCVIGFAAVIPDSWKTASAESFLQKICTEVDQTAFARLTVEDWDILNF